ncbi:hypothetical protein [Thalassomonas sp. M1454]|uniref:hypothetical protein n=1 Tax=Thalassomonas sp. M1454 TaxID=2594477 RepID=UPI00117F13BC|nr:hypothetical protein [Thalassomonas sp. M1454]TRX54021.1 hypothetical protein FNN08_13825 [Thalassomonas sp. M1454]
MLTKLRQEESSRFNNSPYIYAISLFLMIFGLIICAWNIIDLLFIPTINISYSIATIVSLLTTIVLLLFLDLEFNKTASKQ